MSQFEEVGPAKPITESIRVDKVSPRARVFHNLRALAVLVMAILCLIPIFLMIVTAFRIV